MNINWFNILESFELGDNQEDEPSWYIVDIDGNICAGPYDSKQEAWGDTRRLQWFRSSKHSIEYGINNDGTFVDAETGLEEDADQIPEPGDAIRTKKMQMEGKVESIGKNNAGYDEVRFRLADGRLMKTPLSNVIIIQKLADEDHEIMETELNEISNELLGRYKTAAGKQASEADKKGDFKKGDKRFGGIVKATKKQLDNDTKKKNKDVKEGGMGGLNRSAPAVDVSYENILNDVTDKWRGSTVKVK